MNRCPWCGTDPLYVRYHDEEWGSPLHDEDKHFEFLLLETQQAGLSWITILRKREAYREAFAGFDPGKVARFGQAQVEKLMGNPGIIKNRRKIEASISNAKAFLAIQEEAGSFDRWIWNFAGGHPLVNAPQTLADIPATSPLSDSPRQGAQAPRLFLCGLDHYLCPPPGYRGGKRSPRLLFPLF